MVGFKKVLKSKNPKAEWVERVVAIQRVTKVVKGGKKLSFRAIVVVGNENGQVGVGKGKAGDVITAVRKGVTDGKKNVLPGKVTMTGDARALSSKTNEMIEKNMNQIVKGICNAHGVSYKIIYKTTCPVTFNEFAQAESATKAAKSLLGEKKTNGDIEPRLFSEDFSIMSK